MLESALSHRRLSGGAFSGVRVPISVVQSQAPISAIHMLRVQIRASNVLLPAGKTRGGTILKTVGPGRVQGPDLGQYRQRCRGVKADDDFVGRKPAAGEIGVGNVR